jgi:hypothetical protein
MRLTVFLPTGILEGWVAGTKIIFAEIGFRPILMWPSESPLEALHRVFGKCTVEVF